MFLGQRDIACLISLQLWNNCKNHLFCKGFIAQAQVMAEGDVYQLQGVSDTVCEEAVTSFLRPPPHPRTSGHTFVFPAVIPNPHVTDGLPSDSEEPTLNNIKNATPNCRDSDCVSYVYESVQTAGFEPPSVLPSDGYVAAPLSPDSGLVDCYASFGEELDYVLEIWLLQQPVKSVIEHLFLHYFVSAVCFISVVGPWPTFLYFHLCDVFVNMYWCTEKSKTSRKWVQLHAVSVHTCTSVFIATIICDAFDIDGFFFIFSVFQRLPYKKKVFSKYNETFYSAHLYCIKKARLICNCLGKHFSIFAEKFYGISIDSNTLRKLEPEKFMPFCCGICWQKVFV